MIDETAKQKLADELIGTSGVYDDMFADAAGVQPADLAATVADYACQCSRCGWWVDAMEVNENEECEECVEYGD